MLLFIIKRLGYGILVSFGVVSVIFFLFTILPGDPARMMLGQRADQESIDRINKDLGLDQSIGRQYVLYLNDLSPISFHNSQNSKHYLYLDQAKYNAQRILNIGNWSMVMKYPYLRRSYQSQKNVSAIIAESLPATIVLAGSAILIALFLGLIIGIFSALYKNTFIDRIALFFSVLGMSGPSFFIAIIVAWIFGFLLNDYTGLNMTGSLFTLDNFGEREYLDLKNLVLPAITLGVRPLAVIVQLTRNSMLDVLDQDYIRTARAKGLSNYKVIVKHALRNALNPVITATSGWFASLMAGAVFVELVFAWKGIGWEVVNALQKFDFPVVMGIVLIIGIIFVLLNILVDILYTYLDPRIALK